MNLTKEEQAVLAAITGILANSRNSKDLTPWYNKILQWFIPSINRKYATGNCDDVIRNAKNYAKEFLKEYPETL